MYMYNVSSQQIAEKWREKTSEQFTKNRTYDSKYRI